jgi:hypothetical protein
MPFFALLSTFATLRETALRLEASHKAPSRKGKAPRAADSLRCFLSSAKLITWQAIRRKH